MIILYTTGSSLSPDVEESAFRAGLAIRAAIRNREVPPQTSPDIPIFDADALPDGLAALPFLVPLFTPGDRQAVAAEASARGFLAPGTLVDPTALVPRRTRFGAGTYVNAGCILGAGGDFGAFTLLNRSSTVGHHARFGDFVSVGPGVVIAGNVQVGRGAMIGAGAVVLPEIVIGENAVIGAGAVVTRDVPAFCVALGNPARVTQSGIQGFKGKTVS